MTDFEPDEVKQHSDGSWYMGKWTTCSCGKEFHVYARDDTYELTVGMLRLRAACVCRRCAAERSKRMDTCPQYVPIPRGVAACRLSYAHTGRCEPWEFKPDVWQKE